MRWWPPRPPSPTSAQVVRILAVVDRNQGAAQIFQQRGYPFTALFTVNELLPAERE